MTDHPDRTLTLRQAFEELYDQSDLSHAAIITYRATFKAWEKLTDDPPICEITDEVLENFRQAAIEHPYKPHTINTYWTHIRAIMRRCGPKFTGNPRGLGIIDEVPWMKTVRVQKRVPKRITLDDLSAFYVACRHAEFPRCGMHPADWWRGLIVVAYFTGLRRGDLFNLQWDQIDMKQREIDFTSRKTGKAAILPMHACVVKHLERIQVPLRTGRIFNQIEELREAIDKMRVPSGFNAGPKVAAKRYEEARQARVEMRQEDFEIPSGADPRDWQFRTGAFYFRGTWYPMPGIQRLSILRKLVEAPEPVHWRELVPIIWGEPNPKIANIQRRVHASISKVRQRLRKCFDLPDSIDPVPCVAYGDGGSWTIWIPPEVNRQAG